MGVTTDLDKARLNVKTTWLMNIETLTKENPNFQLIIDVLSFLDPTGIPSLILDPKIPGLPEEMTALLKDGHIIHKLTKYSLFSRDPLDKKLLTVHRMVQDVIKDAVQKDKTRLKQTLQNAEQMLEFLSNLGEKEGRISNRNNDHFGKELETLSEKKILDEQYLTDLIARRK